MKVLTPPGGAIISRQQWSFPASRRCVSVGERLHPIRASSAQGTVTHVPCSRQLTQHMTQSSSEGCWHRQQRHVRETSETHKTRIRPEDMWDMRAVDLGNFSRRWPITGQSGAPQRSSPVANTCACALKFILGMRPANPCNSKLIWSGLSSRPPWFGLPESHANSVNSITCLKFILWLRTWFCPTDSTSYSYQLTCRWSPSS